MHAPLGAPTARRALCVDCGVWALRGRAALETGGVTLLPAASAHLALNHALNLPRSAPRSVSHTEKLPALCTNLEP